VKKSRFKLRHRSAQEQDRCEAICENVGVEWRCKLRKRSGSRFCHNHRNLSEATGQKQTGGSNA
jgi:hypothetical protein